MPECPTCGSNEFESIDGHYYCVGCNALSQTQREEELGVCGMLGFDISGGGPQLSYLRSSAVPAEQRANKRTAQQRREDALFCPAELGFGAERVAVMSKILNRTARTMVKDMKLPKSYVEHVRDLWIGYLQQSKVAFCLEELEIVEENEEGIIQTTKKAKTELDDIQNLLLQMTMPEEEKEQTKKLRCSSEVMENAKQFYLSILLAQAILYAAAQQAGARWILMSDIARWFRERRLTVSQQELYALSSGKDRPKKLIEDTLLTWPLEMHYRHVVALCQVLRIPREPILIDFDRLICRLLYNLNLPTCLLDRVQRLNIKVPAHCGLCVDRFKLDYADCALWPSTSQLSALKTPIQSLEGNNLLLSGFVTLSDETKAAAYLLAALRLVFGLDGVGEILISEEASETNIVAGTSNAFEWNKWFDQIQKRIAVYDGKPVSSCVLNNTDHLPSTTIARRYSEDVTQKRRRLKAVDCSDPDRKVFSGCLAAFPPAHLLTRPFTNAFGYNDEIMSNDWDSLIAPLRYQGSSKTVDGEHGELFEHCFEKTTLDFMERDFIEELCEAYKMPKSCVAQLKPAKVFPCAPFQTDYSNFYASTETLNRQVAAKILKEVKSVCTSSLSATLEIISLSIGEEEAYVFLLSDVVMNNLTEKVFKKRKTQNTKCCLVENIERLL